MLLHPAVWESPSSGEYRSQAQPHQGSVIDLGYERANLDRANGEMCAESVEAPFDKLRAHVIRVRAHVTGSRAHMRLRAHVRLRAHLAAPPCVPTRHNASHGYR